MSFLDEYMKVGKKSKTVPDSKGIKIEDPAFPEFFIWCEPSSVSIKVRVDKYGTVQNYLL